MKIIPNWHKLNLTCSCCNGEKSVKYEKDRKPFCNVCILREKEQNPLQKNIQYLLEGRNED